MRSKKTKSGKSPKSIHKPVPAVVTIAPPPVDGDADDIYPTLRDVEFAKGIRRSMIKRTTKEAIEAFRKYLLINLRLTELRHPHDITDEDAQTLFETLVTAEERAQIEKLITAYRRTGFWQYEIDDIKKQRGRYQARLVLPYQNSKKGRKGGRPRKAEK